MNIEKCYGHTKIYINIDTKLYYLALNELLFILINLLCNINIINMNNNVNNNTVQNKLHNKSLIDFDAIYQLP
jgi:hypothetical protein